jgi:eukaryotic-like serine/threonine-protein kinase
MREIGPGSRLDRYEILALVGEGGMGHVWKGLVSADDGSSRTVALKTIRPEYAELPRVRDMLLDEARIASRIEHPNVVQIVDLGEDDGVLYLVMDWVDGVTLLALAEGFEARGERLPLAVLARVVSDAATGLHAAHELVGPDGAPLSVVHRDVSPDNILVSALGVGRLTDFGIAKARQRVARETTAGRFKGKLTYASPEHAGGLRVTRASDIWSLGAVVYRLVTGAPAFRDANELASYINGAAPPPLPNVPRDLEVLIRRAMSIGPAERHASALEFARELQAAVPVRGT